MTIGKRKIVFISHSEADSKYAAAIVDMLFALKLDEEDIVCSSYDGVGIPLGEKVYEWLVDKFQNYDLHVIFLLSRNYYSSVACLNEMGAAWALNHKWDGILLPGFDFGEIKGCIRPDQISIKLDGDQKKLRSRLNELKDNIVAEFGVTEPSHTRWEHIRDEFMEKVEVQTTYQPAPSGKRMGYSQAGIYPRRQPVYKSNEQE